VTRLSDAFPRLVFICLFSKILSLKRNGGLD
jgi:hypothetical protein